MIPDNQHGVVAGVNDDPAINPEGRSSGGEDTEDEGERPPLPPRPNTIGLLGGSPKSLQVLRRSSRPQLQSTATTALQLTDIQTQTYGDGSRETYTQSMVSRKSSRYNSPRGQPRKSYNGSEDNDSASVRSFTPIAGTGDVEALFGEVLGPEQHRHVHGLLDEGINFSESVRIEEPTPDFNREFDELGDIDADGSNEEELLNQWRSKRKHFHILSAAGKPIYNRHGSDNLISGEVGVIQTIISFYEGGGDKLKGFTAGRARFVIITRGPLYLVAISKLGESDVQLQVQLEALYMQILSTLTLPTLNGLFSKRPSTDLRRPLQGTDALLSALADTFTRGSPSTLLSALECLKIRKSQRLVINNTMLKTKCKDLLYGLIVAGGRLVSVVRPRSHSLHPSDLQLIFNMLFEAGGVKAGGGESWIPMCLPGFNRNGYLYMYVSFLGVEDEHQGEGNPEDRIAILLISPNKESFYELRIMRDDLIDELEKNGQMDTIKQAVLNRRPTVTDIAPGTVLKHFLYKSRANLQYVMPSYEPHFTTVLERRRLLSLYHRLHASVHAKGSHLTVQQCVNQESMSLAWVTPMFEIYCVAAPSATRNALAQGANKVVQWIRREEERVFIIGGAVF